MNCGAEDCSRNSIHEEQEFPDWTKTLGVSKDELREARLQELASRLLFNLRKEGSRFGLYRDAGPRI